MWLATSYVASAASLDGSFVTLPRWVTGDWGRCAAATPAAAVAAGEDESACSAVLRTDLGKVLGGSLSVVLTAVLDPE